MINQNHLNQIQKILDLEKIGVVQTLSILCFKKSGGLDFVLKVTELEKDLKKEFGPNIELKIVDEGEIDDVKSIELCGTSDTNELGEHGQ